LLVRTTGEYVSVDPDTIEEWCILALRSGKPRDGKTPAGVDEEQMIGADSYYETIKCKEMGRAGDDSTNGP
jgi:hypothetical protein